MASDEITALLGGWEGFERTGVQRESATETDPHACGSGCAERHRGHLAAKKLPPHEPSFYRRPPQSGPA